jgi:hypothetical protein
MNLTFNININFPTSPALIELLSRLIPFQPPSGDMTMAQKTLDDILDLVHKETSMIGGLKTTFTELKQQVQDLLAGQTLPSGLQAKVDAIFDAAAANASDIQDSLLANTPLAPPVDPAPVDPAPPLA